VEAVRGGRHRGAERGPGGQHAEVRRRRHRQVRPRGQQRAEGVVGQRAQPVGKTPGHPCEGTGPRKLSVPAGRLRGMDYIDYLDVIEQESAVLAETAGRPGTLAGALPACAGWTGDGLIRHIGEVQAFWTAVVRAGGVQPGQVPGAEPGEQQDVLEWYDEARAGLVKALHEVPPDAQL